MIRSLYIKQGAIDRMNMVLARKKKQWQVVIFEKNTFLVITRAHTKEMQAGFYKHNLLFLQSASGFDLSRSDDLMEDFPDVVYVHLAMIFYRIHLWSSDCEIGGQDQYRFEKLSNIIKQLES